MGRPSVAPTYKSPAQVAPESLIDMNSPSPAKKGQCFDTLTSMMTIFYEMYLPCLMKYEVMFCLAMPTLYSYYSWLLSKSNWNNLKIFDFQSS